MAGAGAAGAVCPSAPRNLAKYAGLCTRAALAAAAAATSATSAAAAAAVTAPAPVRRAADTGLPADMGDRGGRGERL